MRRLAVRLVATLLTAVTLFGVADLAHPSTSHGATGFGWPSPAKK